MVKYRKRWMYVPPKPKKPAVPETVKEELTVKAQDLIERHLKPKHIRKPPKDPEQNYLIDIWTKWFRSYFYFCATYASPSPHAFSPTFELRFARMEYTGNGIFNMAYMRHTGQWWPLHFGFSIDECLAAIRDEPHFRP